MLELNPQSSMAHWAQSVEEQMAGQREQLRARFAEAVARNSGAHWEPTGPDAGRLSLRFFQQPLTVQVPDYTVWAADGNPAPTMTQALVTSYLLTANGAERAGEWIAFRDLPNGAFYHAAYTGYTGGLLARTLGDDLEAFRRGAKATGGHVLSALGDAAFEFQALPRIWLAAVYWLGDDEDDFPPQASVLFDRAAGHYLIIDGLAIVGSQLVRRILAQAHPQQ